MPPREGTRTLPARASRRPPHTNLAEEGLWPDEDSDEDPDYVPGDDEEDSSSSSCSESSSSDGSTCSDDDNESVSSSESANINYCTEE